MMKKTHTLEINFQRSCMDRLASGLYGVGIETSVITLTTISILAVTGELLIGLKIVQEPPNSNSEAERSKNGTTTVQTISDPRDNDVTYDPGGDNLSYRLNIANSVFHYISLVIAALFLLEMFLKVISRGRSFFVFPWQVFDCLVVLVAIGIEITLMCVSIPQPYWEAVTYIVVLRYWRIPYVCNIRANARQIEFDQELESWRAAKQKSDEKCRNLQFKLDQYKLENMVNDKTNGHIPRRETPRDNLQNLRSRSDSMVNNLQASKNSTLNGIITSQQNGHSVIMSERDDSTDSKINNINNINNDDQIEVEEITHRVKTVNFNVSFETEVSPSPTQRHQISLQSTRSRDDSESSISYQTTEEEVVVQIENALQTELSPIDDATNLIPEANLNKDEYAFDNVTFDDLDDLVFRKDLQVMADIDGTKTYRSADGIPMTSL